MIVLLFGATGLAGGGVLQACLAAPDVSEVRAVVRRSTGVSDPRLREIVHDNYLDYAAIAHEFDGLDTCLFCLGVSVQQAPVEVDYRRIHHGFPLAAAKMLRTHSPAAQFHYLSGMNAALDSRWMWARVKAEAERDLMREYQATCWRPGMIGGAPGANTARWLAILNPLLTPLFRPFRSLYAENTDIGRAMLAATRQRLGARVIENAEIRRLAGS